MGHRNRGNHWTLWRRSGDDRRIKRTETWEGVLCERWDSRRGSVRRALPYRAGRQESTRWRQESAVTTGYHGAIIILSGQPRIKDLERLPRKARRNKTTPMRSSVSCLAACGTTISAGEDLEGLTVWPNEITLLQDAQKVRPARPQAIRNRRRTLWGTLRISMSENDAGEIFQHSVVRHLESAN
jgi:hypothetical protein